MVSLLIIISILGRTTLSEHWFHSPLNSKQKYGRLEVYEERQKNDFFSIIKADPKKSSRSWLCLLCTQLFTKHKFEVWRKRRTSVSLFLIFSYLVPALERKGKLLSRIRFDKVAHTIRTYCDWPAIVAIRQSIHCYIIVWCISFLRSFGARVAYVTANFSCIILAWPI